MHEPPKPPLPSASLQQKNIKEILDRHYPQHATDPGRYAALLRPNNTFKASLLHDALDRYYISPSKYLDYTCCVRIESVAIPPRHSQFIPVFMCIDEGSEQEFGAELARLFGEDAENVVGVSHVKFWDNKYRCEWNKDWQNMVPVLFKDDKSVARIGVEFEGYGASKKHHE